jgi:hypothetical protein
LELFILIKIIAIALQNEAVKLILQTIVDIKELEGNFQLTEDLKLEEIIE